jgi:hypothetical protein
MVAAMVTSCLDNRYQVGLSSMCGLLGLWLEACASPGAASDQPGVQDGITTNFEDEMHCLVKCSHSAKLWHWLLTFLRNPLPWTTSLTDMNPFFGMPLNMYGQIQQAHRHIWKLFHAETLRIIWYSRCRKRYDNEMVNIQALKNIVLHRVQSTLSIYEAAHYANIQYLQMWHSIFSTSSRNRNGRLRLNLSS